MHRLTCYSLSSEVQALREQLRTISEHKAQKATDVQSIRTITQRAQSLEAQLQQVYYDNRDEYHKNCSNITIPVLL